MVDEKGATERGDIRQFDKQIEVMSHLTQRAAAWLLGVSTKTLRRLSAPRQQDGGYHAQELQKWNLERQQRKVEGDIDPLMTGGGNSPALEEYRRQKVRELTRKNDEAEGKLVETALEIQEWSRLGETLRREIELAFTEHTPSPEVEKAVWDAITRACETMLKRLEAQQSGDNDDKADGR